MKDPASAGSRANRAARATAEGGSGGVGDVRIAVTGTLAGLTPQQEAMLLDRGRASDSAVEDAVRVILSDVRKRGDEALRSLARRFDRVELTEIEVPRAAWNEALAGLDTPVRSALERAAANIAAFHRAQLPPPLEVEVEPGVRLGRRAEPLRRVAVYAPGGRASYPSSVLMGVVPARVAGVEEVVVCSPPGPDGRPPAAVLAACALAGADRVFAVGGAGAVAALAYGTASVPRVDKVVGPGNAYVTEAKRQLNGTLAIDCPAGPSEVLILADDTADPTLLAAEMIAQAEHDPDAASVLVCTDAAVLEAARAELARLLPAQPRLAIIEASLAARGAFLLADGRDAAIDFANSYAPEHLLVLLREPRSALVRLRNAGSIFLGASCSVAFGDYITGANHVLPTAGLARAYAGLSTADFLRWSTYQELSPSAAASLAGDTAVLARAEGLPGHALCAQLREWGSGREEEGGNDPPGFAAPGSAATTTTPDPDPMWGCGGMGVRGNDTAPSASRLGNGTAGDAEAARDADYAREQRPLPHSPTPPLGRAGARFATPLRSAYRDIALYDPKRTPIDVDLSDNTSLFGAPAAAMRALRELEDEDVTRYPPVYADRLKAALAELHGIAPEQVVTGGGSDDVIDSAIRAFCEPGDVVAYPDPTFSMVPWFARMNAARPVGVPMAPGFELDDDALLSARGRVTYICNPNNPTGSVLSGERVRRLGRGAAGVVLIDEAYADYCGESFVADAVASDRVLVLRTLSKAFGLAGLRIGYAIGPEALVREVEKSRGPYKVSAAANAAALAALAQGRDWAARNIATVRGSRERLTTELSALGCRVWPSGANFLLVQAPPAGEAGSAAALGAALRERGVAVRTFAGLPRAGDCIRVSIGPWPLMERFLEALRQVVPGAGGEGA